jgi:hypothetical protein
MIVFVPFLYPYGKRPPAAFSSPHRPNSICLFVFVRGVAAPSAARNPRATPTVRLHKEELDWVSETLHLWLYPASKGCRHVSAGGARLSNKNAGTAAKAARARVARRPGVTRTGGRFPNVYPKKVSPRAPCLYYVAGRYPMRPFTRTTNLRRPARVIRAAHASADNSTLLETKTCTYSAQTKNG